MSDSPAVILYDANGKALEVENGVAIPANTRGLLMHGRDGSGNARAFEMVEDSGSWLLKVDGGGGGGAGSEVKIVDSTGTYTAEVTASGELKVVQAPPSSPPGKTGASDYEVSTHQNGNYQNYTIPTGEILTLQQFVAGCAGEGGKGARVTLLYDQGGGQPIQDQEIARLYVQASSAILPLDWTAPRAAQSGDRIRIYRYALEGSTQETYGYWKGYY